MACKTISEIRQFNEDARQALDELKRHQAASAASAEASHLPTAGEDGGLGFRHPKQGTDKITLTQHLVLAEEHVARGEKIVARQRKNVDELERDGHASASKARALLAQFEEIQALHIAGRNRLLKGLSELK